MWGPGKTRERHSWHGCMAGCVHGQAVTREQSCGTQCASQRDAAGLTIAGTFLNVLRKGTGASLALPVVPLSAATGRTSGHSREVPALSGGGSRVPGQSPGDGISALMRRDGRVFSRCLPPTPTGQPAARCVCEPGNWPSPDTKAAGSLQNHEKETSVLRATSGTMVSQPEPRPRSEPSFCQQQELICFHGLGEGDQGPHSSRQEASWWSSHTCLQPLSHCASCPPLVTPPPSAPTPVGTPGPPGQAPLA